MTEGNFAGTMGMAKQKDQRIWSISQYLSYVPALGPTDFLLSK